MFEGPLDHQNDDNPRRYSPDDELDPTAESTPSSTEPDGSVDPGLYPEFEDGS